MLMFAYPNTPCLVRGMQIVFISPCHRRLFALIDYWSRNDVTHTVHHEPKTWRDDTLLFIYLKKWRVRKVLLKWNIFEKFPKCNPGPKTTPTTIFKYDIWQTLAIGLNKKWHAKSVRKRCVRKAVKKLHILTSAAFFSASSSFSWASLRASEYLSSSSSVPLSFFCSAMRSSSSCACSSEWLTAVKSGKQSARGVWRQRKRREERKVREIQTGTHGKIPWWRPRRRSGASPRHPGTPQALYHARPRLRATSFPTELARLLTTHA